MKISRVLLESLEFRLAHLQVFLLLFDVGLELRDGLLVLKQIAFFVNEDPLKFLVFVLNINSFLFQLDKTSLVFFFKTFKILSEAVFDYLPLVFHYLFDGELLVATLSALVGSICSSEQHLDLLF